MAEKIILRLFLTNATIFNSQLKVSVLNRRRSFFFSFSSSILFCYPLLFASLIHLFFSFYLHFSSRVSLLIVSRVLPSPRLLSSSSFSSLHFIHSLYLLS